MDDVFVIINGVSHPVRCGVCRQPIGFIGEINGETDQAGCDYCDNFAAVKVTVEIALKYAENAAQLKLSRAAIDSGRRGNVIPFNRLNEHENTASFVVDLDP